MERRDSARDNEKKKKPDETKEEKEEYGDDDGAAEGESGDDTNNDEGTQRDGKSRSPELWEKVHAQRRTMMRASELNERAKCDKRLGPSDLERLKSPPTTDQDRRVHLIDAGEEKRDPRRRPADFGGRPASQAVPRDSITTCGDSTRAKEEAYMEYGRDSGAGTDADFGKRGREMDRAPAAAQQFKSKPVDASPPELNGDQTVPAQGAWRVEPGGVVRLDRRRQVPDDEVSESGSSPEEDRDMLGEPGGDNRNDGASTARQPHFVATVVQEFDLIDAKMDTSRRKRIIRVGSLTLLVVVVIIVAVAVGVTMASKRGRPTPLPPTQPPTLAPTMAPVLITAAMVDAALNDTRLSNSTFTAMLLEGTPQYKASQWLRTKANGGYIRDDSKPIHRLVQQFALAVLYYASASAWTNASGWLSNENECDWFGCSCHQTATGSWELQGLDLSQNGLVVEALPSEIGVLDSLVSLDLSVNEIAGTLLSELGLLSSLQLLALNSNAFTGSIPSELYMATDLVSLTMDDNMLTGTVSPLVGQLTKLTALNLWINNEELSGRLPTEMGLLTSLSELQMRSTQLSGGGTIPQELGRMGALTTFVLSGYGYQGTIPEELSMLTQLNTLDVRMNELTGTIPAKLGSLTRLTKLDLSNNNGIAGTVPGQLCNLIHSNNLALCVTYTAVSCSDSCGCSCV